MQNTIIYLIGHPGVGKLTIAKIICEKTNASLVDNHTLGNPIHCLKNVGEISLKVKYLKAIRDIVFEAMVDLPDKNASFILTNVLCDNENDWFEPVENMSQKRNATFIPVVLTCDLEENIKRVKSLGRKENHKTTKAEVVEKFHKLGMIKFNHPNRLDLDTTNISAEETANLILEHVCKIKEVKYKLL